MQTCAAVGVLVLAWCKGGGGRSLQDHQQESDSHSGEGDTKIKCSVPQKNTHSHIPLPLHYPAHPSTSPISNSIPSKSNFPLTHSKPTAEMTDKVDENEKKQEDRKFFPLFVVFPCYNIWSYFFRFFLIENLSLNHYLCVFTIFDKDQLPIT